MNRPRETSAIIDVALDDDDDDGGWNTVPSGRKERKSTTGAAHPVSSSLLPDESNPPFMIVLSGIPGSGKSHFAQALSKVNPNRFVRICQDVLGSRAKCERASRESLSKGKVPIIDRCNFSPSQRESFLVIAKEHNAPIDCIVFEYSQNECIRRCEERPSHETLNRKNARGVVSKVAREYEPPFENTDLQYFRHMKHISSFGQSNAAVSEYLLLQGEIKREREISSLGKDWALDLKNMEIPLRTDMSIGNFARGPMSSQLKHVQRLSELTDDPQERMTLLHNGAKLSSLTIGSCDGSDGNTKNQNAYAHIKPVHHELHLLLQNEQSLVENDQK